MVGYSTISSSKIFGSHAHVDVRNTVSLLPSFKPDDEYGLEKYIFACFERRCQRWRFEWMMVAIRTVMFRMTIYINGSVHSFSGSSSESDDDSWVDSSDSGSDDSSLSVESMILRLGRFGDCG